MMQAVPENNQTTRGAEIDLQALEEIRSGLTSQPKSINPKYFYDERGSQLFDQITRLDEYYPTRTEIALLKRYADDIAAVTGLGNVVVEPGAGSCAKVRLLMDALQPACYVPIDISGDYLFAAAELLQAEYPDIPVHPIADDMQSNVELPAQLDGTPRLVFYPGSTIGNYNPAQALEFLRHVRRTIGDNGGLLIGVDLEKDTDVLNRAYNDATGITADFNLNILNHINRITGANFQPSGFEHVAFYNEQDGRIEMHLESKVAQSVTLAGETISLAAGERVLTEYSHKYTLKSFAQLAALAGLVANHHWVDDEQLFSLQYFTAQQDFDAPPD
jgi:dimethylhistidine N-methyltransferase